MRTIIAWMIYLPLQILWIPILLIGSIMIYYRQMKVSKKLGVSSTAIEIINGRWTMDRFEMRDDSATVKLFSVLPNTTVWGQWMALFPFYVLYKIAGTHLIYPTLKMAPQATLANLVPTRTYYIDEILRQSLSNTTQFVVLGAGLDTRCYGDLIHPQHQCYECDLAHTQHLKTTYLNRANIAADNVQFVSVDFTQETWPETLISAGFNPTISTTFLWEGVTLYLTKPEVLHTLKMVRQLAAPESTLVADFYSNQFVNGKLLPGKDLIKETNETLQFGVSFEGAKSQELMQLLQHAGWELQQGHYLGSATKTGTWMSVIGMHPVAP